MRAYVRACLLACVRACVLACECMVVYVRSCTLHLFTNGRNSIVTPVTGVYSYEHSFQLRTRDGEFVPATPMDGVVLVNVGDLMQRWTDDKLVSTVSRTPH